VRHSDRRTEAGESGADDDRVKRVAHRPCHSHVLIAIAACQGRGTRTRPLNTS
jgi:hypothetical protein